MGCLDEKTTVFRGRIIKVIGAGSKSSRSTGAGGVRAQDGREDRESWFVSARPWAARPARVETKVARPLAWSVTVTDALAEVSHKVEGPG
jgi:hypothetical protein